MSGDRLAQIEAKLIGAKALDRYETHLFVLTHDEAEALVEIAKAARDFTEYEAGRQPMLGDRWYALTDALARLAPPAEDQGDSGAAE